MDNFPGFYDETKFWRFVLPPTDPLSLKLVFDNVRNYTISAAVIAAGRYYGSVGGDPVSVWLIEALGIVLVVVTAAQSWVLGLKIFYHFSGFTRDELNPHTIRTDITGTIKILLLSVMLVGFPLFTWKLISSLLKRP